MTSDRAGDRVAAQREEVVVDAEPRRACQDLAPQPRQRCSRAVCGGVRRGRRLRRAVRAPAAPCGPPCRWGSSGSASSDDERRRDHVRRAGAARARRPGPVAATSGRRDHDVGDQALLAARVLRAPRPRTSRTPGWAATARLDLAQLDAEAAHLDLVVDAAQELERAVRQPARQVAGAVQPRARRGRERVGDEALGRQLGPAEVAARQARAADVQLAGHARPAPAASARSST